jgi:hypothetical protein
MAFPNKLTPFLLPLAPQIIDFCYEYNFNYFTHGGGIILSNDSHLIYIWPFTKHAYVDFLKINCENSIITHNLIEYDKVFDNSLIITSFSSWGVLKEFFIYSSKCKNNFICDECLKSNQNIICIFESGNIYCNCIHNSIQLRLISLINQNN